ncbi:MAG: 30S ribosomal protein S4 [Candidatus Colwellbacteria bacterium]|nr:30S ribosomal protein S4 [Candidatus Colwellbacteria bacterium]
MPRVLEKRERSLGVKLSIRGERASSPKSALLRKPYRPGQHGKRFSRRPSDYGVQLKEKQKIQASYGLTNKQLARLFEEAAKRPESTVLAITQALETRLDNVITRLGFAPSRSVARQLVSHGHFLVNNKKMTTPSYRVKAGDVITIKPTSKSIALFTVLPEELKSFEVPSWLSLDKEKLEGRVESLPLEVSFPFDINLVVDYYSR